MRVANLGMGDEPGADREHTDPGPGLLDQIEQLGAQRRITVCRGTSARPADWCVARGDLNCLGHLLRSWLRGGWF